MEKKFRLSDKTTVAKIVYAAVVALLCVSAIVVGIIAAASKKDEVPDTETPSGNQPEEPDDSKSDETPEEDEKPTVYNAPVAGEVVKFHSLDTPVFSDTLGEWRVHTGIDIQTPDGASVYSAAAGTVTKVFDDVRLGRTVEITHAGGVVSCYSNLAKDSTTPTVGAEIAAGERIGTVGDTSLSELAEEPHLHFEIKVGGSSVNPLDSISEESKESSLGIRES